MQRVNINKNQIITLYNAIPEESDEKMKKYIDLRDIKINSREDLVKVCQTFRNPKYETFRIIYMRDNNIVNYETITSRLPNSCDIFKFKAKTPFQKNIKGYQDISRRMYRLGANGYYLQHNHPSGNAKASINDMWVTQEIDENIKGFKGHIIVDHGTYSWIEKDIEKNILKAINNINIESIHNLDSQELIKDDPLMHKKINSRNDLARIMYDIKHSNHYSCLVLTSAINNIRLFQEVPNTFINMSYRQIGGYIKNRCIDTGSTRAFLATTDRPFFERAKDLVELGYLSDCLAYTVTKDKAEIVDVADSEYVDQDIFTSIKANDELRKEEKWSEKVR